MKKLLLLSALAATTCLNAQNTAKKAYTMSAGETIFSWGNIDAPPLNTTNKLRFTIFLHLGQQLHVDFSDKAGFYTGLALRNVGTITDLNDTVKIKQRVYTLGIPVAFKFGNMNGTHVALGAEGELAINYKQKVFENGEKSKMNEWFSDKTNTFLPSLFGELRLKDGFYLKYKYYLTDFLQAGKQKTNVPNLNYNPVSSHMMYVSLGFAIRNRTLTQQAPKAVKM
jgi:hypothetical protein